MTRPQSKAEAIARANGYEYRHVYRQGPGAARAARTFTRRQSNKAMRRHRRWLLEEALAVETAAPGAGSRRGKTRQTP